MLKKIAIESEYFLSFSDNLFPKRNIFRASQISSIFGMDRDCLR